MDPAILGALAGFFGALVTLGIPLCGFLLRLDRRVGKALALLVGKEDVDGDGVLARLRAVEQAVARIEAALAEVEQVDYEVAADGGSRDP